MTLDDLMKQQRDSNLRLQELELQERLPIVAMYTRSTVQTIANNTMTIVDFATKAEDTHNSVTVGASWKFTAPIAGFYNIHCRNLFVNTNTWGPGEYAQANIYVNGVFAANAGFHTYPVAVGASVYTSLGGSFTTHLNKGDYLDIRVIQTSGAALNLHGAGEHNFVCISKI